MHLSFEDSRKVACAISAGGLWIFYLVLLQSTRLLSELSINTAVLRLGTGMFYWASFLMVARFFWPQFRRSTSIIVLLNSFAVIMYTMMVTHVIEPTADHFSYFRLYHIAQVMMGAAILLLAWVLWNHLLTPKFVSILLYIHGIIWIIRTLSIIVDHPQPLFLTLARVMTYVAEVPYGLSWFWVAYAIVKSSKKAARAAL